MEIKQIKKNIFDSTMKRKLLCHFHGVEQQTKKKEIPNINIVLIVSFSVIYHIVRRKKKLFVLYDFGIGTINFFFSSFDCPIQRKPRYNTHTKKNCGFEQ
jgi:hypothetical protein